CGVSGARLACYGRRPCGSLCRRSPCASRASDASRRLHRVGPFPSPPERGEGVSQRDKSPSGKHFPLHPPSAQPSPPYGGRGGITNFTGNEAQARLRRPAAAFGTAGALGLSPLIGSNNEPWRLSFAAFLPARAVTAGADFS